MIVGWILYLILGGALAVAGVFATTWQYWAVMACVVAIDIWSHICAKKED